MRSMELANGVAAQSVGCAMRTITVPGIFWCARHTLHQLALPQDPVHAIAVPGILWCARGTLHQLALPQDPVCHLHDPGQPLDPGYARKNGLAFSGLHILHGVEVLQ